MDYLKPQYEFLKGRLKGKDNQFILCVDDLHLRSGVLTSEYFMFIPDEKRFVRENTIREPMNVTPICSKISYTEVKVIKTQLHFDKRLVCIFDNDTKANKKFLDYFDGCKFYNDGKTKPIYCCYDDELVGVVMPIR